MSAPVHPPSSRRVAEAWLKRAVPGVGVGTELPVADSASRTEGYVRISGVVGGSPGRYVPMRSPVVGAECWLAPDAKSNEASWSRAENLGERLVAASYDRQLQGVVVDLSGVGSYGSARVHDVTALTEPQRIENDPSGWARVDVDLLINWTAE